ncbi:MAG: hypothetical protein LBR65_02380 [Culturomica sp.]|jgi:hypothetical protein|nr:hypothetical protein [Culturomica sp.]
MEAMANDMRLLREFLSDPTNRQAYISHDLQSKNNKKIATLDRLRRF